MNKIDFKTYIADTYGTEPDFPWESNPTVAVYRHSHNRKWFALVMDIPRSRLGLHEESTIDIVNLKCDPVLTGSLRMEKGGDFSCLSHEQRQVDFRCFRRQR